mgnify:CR=1 FL=1
MYIYVYKRVDVSILFMCDASDIMRYDRRTPELSDAPPRIEQDATSIEI